MTLLAVRALDLAIFATMGSLWVGGAIFIVVLYRWIVRFERGDDTAKPPMPKPATVTEGHDEFAPARGASVPRTAAARTFA
jgi:hypothetical protein